jgi:hypothetical protein
VRNLLFAAAIALVFAGVAQPAAAQNATCPGIYRDGACYVGTGESGPAADPYWPTNTETAYTVGPYAYAPGFGPYLRLGGEGGWNPNLGSTYNSYPPGDYYTDYGFPYAAVRIIPSPLVVRTYYGYPYAAYPCCNPTIYPFGPWGR